MRAIEGAGYKPGEDVVLALDCAATEFFKDGKYQHGGRGQVARRRRAWRNISQTWSRASRSSRSRTAWPRTTGQGWKALTEALGEQVPARRRRPVRHQHRSACAQGIEEGIANSILVKVNQIGSLTETLDAVAMAQRAAYTAVISHRSGETEDATIADLAVATNAGQIKTGSLSRSDRIAKYNQLIRIEEELGDEAAYAGRAVLRR